MDNSSPIRNIQNSFSSNRSGQYEEEFWKIKAQRKQAECEQLKRQVTSLNKKLIDSQRLEQELREKLVDPSDDWKVRSRKMATERMSNKFNESSLDEKNAGAQQIERLTKQIRILKNLHQVELAKVNDQNKKMKKVIGEFQGKKQMEKQNNQNLKIISKLNEEIATLKRKLSSSQESSVKLREDKIKIIADCQSLRKQMGELRMRERLAQKEEQDKLIDFKKYCGEQTDLRLSQRQQKLKEKEGDVGQRETKMQHIPQETQQEPMHLNQIDFEFQDHQTEIANNKIEQLQSEIQDLKKQICKLQKKVKQNQNKLEFEKSSYQNFKMGGQIKMKKLEGQLQDSKTELNNVLLKLAPLLSTKKQLSVNKENIQAKASLSILQVFLKKYKIKVFDV